MFVYCFFLRHNFTSMIYCKPIGIFWILISHNGNNIVFSWSRNHASGAFSFSKRIVIRKSIGSLESILLCFGKQLIQHVMLLGSLLLNFMDEWIEVLVFWIIIVHRKIVDRINKLGLWSRSLFSLNWQRRKWWTATTYNTLRL